VRNGLLTVISLPPETVSQALVNSIFDTLSSGDTDNQFHAIKALQHLNKEVPVEKMCANLLPFGNHENKTLRALAEEVLSNLEQTGLKE